MLPDVQPHLLIKFKNERCKVFNVLFYFSYCQTEEKNERKKKITLLLRITHSSASEILP